MGKFDVMDLKLTQLFINSSHATKVYEELSSAEERTGWEITKKNF